MIEQTEYWELREMIEQTENWELSEMIEQTEYWELSEMIENKTNIVSIYEQTESWEWKSENFITTRRERGKVPISTNEIP